MLFVCKGTQWKSQRSRDRKERGSPQGKCAGRAGAEVGECLLQSGNMFSTLKIPESRRCTKFTSGITSSCPCFSSRSSLKKGWAKK